MASLQDLAPQLLAVRHDNAHQRRGGLGLLNYQRFSPCMQAPLN
jgi:hypothetical protein